VDLRARATGRRGAVVAQETGASRPNGEASARTPNGHELHELARDHAAAGRVRPAGEPLARAKELVQQGRVDEAIELYLGILTVNPSNLKAHNNLGVLLDELRQYEEALEHFAAAEGIAPDNVEVLTNYASTLTSVARYDQAEALLRRALKLDPESVAVRTAIGILYFRRGLYVHAEVELRWVCARDRDSGQAFYYRGEALNRLGHFDEARQAMERAKVLLPNDPRPYYTLGHLYDRRHQAEEAAEMYRHARRLQKP
jgi:tetratricopeptide (TPR) repeat protein